VKVAYFHLQTADNDDRALGEAKVMGYVPETCLLGGVLVWKSIAAGLDPCSGCGGARPRCGGRPRIAKADVLATMAQAETLFRDINAGDPLGLGGLVDRGGE
jgi:hypothetical protein